MYKIANENVAIIEKDRLKSPMRKSLHMRMYSSF